MRIALSLFILALFGIALMAFPFIENQFPPTEKGLGFKLWSGSLQAIVVPLILMGFSFKKNPFTYTACTIWAGWMMVTSLWTLISLGNTSAMTTFGILFVLGVLIFAIACGLYATIELNKPTNPKGEDKEESEGQDMAADA